MRKLGSSFPFAARLLIYILVGAIVFCGGLSIGLSTKISVTDSSPVILSGLIGLANAADGTSATPSTGNSNVVQSSVVSEETQPQSTPPVSSDSSTPASTAPSSAADTTAPATNDPGQSSGGSISPSSSVAEIVAYYNTSANRVKTEATKVVRNYEDLSNIPEHLDVPSAVKSIANTAMNTFLKRDETPVEYATQQDIIANFPVKGETWVSKITADQIESATCEDNGSTYTITLSFNDALEQPNPGHGEGYGTAFNILDVSEIKLDVPGLSLSDVELTYFDGVIKCTIDKATGRMTAANFDMPLILSLNAKIVVSSVKAKIGMDFEHDYSISY